MFSFLWLQIRQALVDSKYCKNSTAETNMTEMNISKAAMPVRMNMITVSLNPTCGSTIIHIRLERQGMFQSLLSPHSQLDYISSRFMKDGYYWLSEQSINWRMNVNESGVISHFTHTRELYYILNRFGLCEYR